MRNPTRQEILDAQLARQWAEWNKSYEVSSPEIQAAANFILANTPAPTMAEVEWDNDKHRFAEAEHPDHGEVIMLNVSQRSDKVRIVFNQYGEFYMGYTSPENLTPTGRRYTLTEVQ
ncbi:hypothetical protein HMPREF3169_07820 [Corynebacterium sp. HMSC08C04]|uniref:hypothetical protein n=1 Tax=Corynebacterium sp. HMSC08C04 TaxID=1581137 RepID=UPI0008A52026|nr:hypothetical protein [Corynebacterium sp. HMSC08C04]OFT33352.1 hypothetical protein HMPREF3169_07820 [Corynebacterium sp. HMSC08C04]